MTDSATISVGQERDAAAVAAISACRELINRSFVLGDAGRRAEVADLFVEDGVLVFLGERAEGRTAIRQTFAERDASGRRTVHAIATMDFHRVTDDEIGVHTVVLFYLLSEGDPLSLTAFALADDVLVKSGSTWRLSSRAVSFLDT